MGKIIAIGGGTLSGNSAKTNIHAINQEIVRLSSVKHPKILFIPTASDDDLKYFENIRSEFEGRHKCYVEPLYLIRNSYTKKELRAKILSTDIIYVGGGNTLKMMTLWRKLGIDKLLKQAYKKDIVLCGVSAGSICWFSYGNSDSRKFTSNSNQLIKVTGLGLIDALHCPHYDAEKLRNKSLKTMMIKVPKIVSIALDNCTALEVVDGKYRILSTKKTANGYRVFWKVGKYHKEKITIKKEFEDLSLLLCK